MFGADLWQLAQRGDSIALIDAASGRFYTYRELHARAADLAARLTLERTEQTRALVLVRAGFDIGSIVAYLGALAAGHVVLLVDRQAGAARHEALIAQYQPEFALSARGDAVELETYPHEARHALHAELALLLSTSGSTGSPKLVRLSHTNLLANARSIDAFLQLGPGERAITSLPFHYSYGLSVLNSHLFAGGSLLVTDASAVRPELWHWARQYECTSFAGVPYSYQILRRIGFEKLDLPQLRTLTQAGGKLPPALVAHYQQLMAARGGRLVVMYGQTEATARMTYLPPEYAVQKPDSIGVAIPAGSLHVMDGERELDAPYERGELVYRGQNVMLGYATSREDLACGDTQRGVLRTGDLGYRDADGFFYVTGRLTRFAKLYGLRIDLEEVERLLRDHGPAAAVSDDERLTLFCEFGDERLFESLRGELAQRLSLNVHTFRFQRVGALPLLTSGKVDYDALEQRTR